MQDLVRKLARAQDVDKNRVFRGGVRPPYFVIAVTAVVWAVLFVLGTAFIVSQ